MAGPLMPQRWAVDTTSAPGSVAVWDPGELPSASSAGSEMPATPPSRSVREAGAPVREKSVVYLVVVDLWEGP